MKSSVVRPITTPEYRVPDIAAGMGEKKKPVEAPPPRPIERPKPVREVKAPASATPKPAPNPGTATACAPDEQRLRNYAARMVEGLGIGPTDDLRLFEADGTPLPNLRSVMLAMSAVELGLLRAGPDLVDGAVRRLAGRMADGRAALEMSKEQ
jgi:hypothetical protein